MNDRDALIEAGLPAQLAQYRALENMGRKVWPDDVLDRVEDWVNAKHGGDCDVRAVATALMAALPASPPTATPEESCAASFGWFKDKPAPAQWPEDVVLTACKAFLSGPTDMCAETEEGEIFGAMLAALATLPPPEDEGVKGLVSALEAMIEAEVDYMTINNLGDPEKQHNVKRARSALASYRGGA